MGLATGLGSQTMRAHLIEASCQMHDDCGRQCRPRGRLSWAGCRPADTLALLGELLNQQPSALVSGGAGANWSRWPAPCRRCCAKSEQSDRR